MAEATDKKGAEAPTYPVERILAESGDFLGVAPHVVAGALARITKKNLTLDEVRDAVKAYETRTVEIDNPVGSNNLKEGRA